MIKLKGHVGATRWLWLAAAVIVLDQLSKWWLVNHFELFQRIELLSWLGITRLHNTRAAFSFLAQAGGWQRWFFAALAIVMSTIMTIWLTKLKEYETRLAVALSLILGGAIGNLIDRSIYGYVIDFFHLYYQDWHYPAFNIADSVICIGAALLIWDSFSSDSGAKK